MTDRSHISFLPQHKQSDLELIAGIIKGTMDNVGMVILFGSYARGDYVDFDRRIDFGEQKTYQSDYDILILTHKADRVETARKQESVLGQYYASKNKQKEQALQHNKTIHITPLRILHKDIENFNKEISDNKYFSVQIKNEGIVILDKGIYKLSEPRELDYKEIQELAQEYYDFRINEIENHLIGSELFFSKNINNLSAYHLQQALENIYHSILLVFTLYSPKSHKLKELNESVYSYAPAISDCFGSPNNDDYTKLCFILIDKAYIEGRYNKDYSITKEELELSTKKINEVLELAKVASLNQIERYGRLFDKQTRLNRQN